MGKLSFGYPTELYWFHANLVNECYSLSFNYTIWRLIKIHAEDTLWTGTPANYTNPDAPQALREVRKLVDDGKYAEATEAAVKLSGKPSDVMLLNSS